jgi:hypothetical protein
MFRFIRRNRFAGVEFCESCSQVCTPACRSRAQRDRLRASFTPGIGPLR